MGPDATADYNSAARERGLRETDPDVQRVMDCARRLQFVAYLTLIPQLPLLAEGLQEPLADWRAIPLVL
jgi:hypothetical protein